MALLDATPTESPLGMAVASDALTCALIQTLVDQKVITKFQVVNAINAARREVNTIKDNPAHRDADLILANLQERFPVA
jgi:hypothetical protein